MSKNVPTVKKLFQPLGMFLGILFGIVLSGGLQWLRDGGVAHGAAIGLVLGVAVFGPAFNHLLSKNRNETA